jgi:DNA primase
MSQVDEIRAAADIVRIVSDYVQLRKGGVNLKGLCPFHQEKTPSFAVHPTKQVFHCFGCGVGGDVFKFVMLIENLSFPEALRRVAEKVGITLREAAGDETFDANARDRATLYKIHEVAAKFFAEQVSGSVEGRAARAYLADRGLSDEVIGRFRLGYAPAEGRALTRRLTEAGFPIALLEKSGLVLRAAEGERHFDRFRRRVIFPIASENGKLVAFGGRALGDDQPKYLNSPETPIYIKSRVLYNLDRAGSQIRKLDRAILVEGYMDCIAVATTGAENVVASCGTSLTESQVRLLGRYSRRVVVNYDPDSAGVAATERSLTLLLEEGLQVQVLALPGGMDPDTFIRRKPRADGPVPIGSREASGGADAYRKLLDSAPSYLDYLTERAASQHDVRTAEGKVAAANAVMPYLARVPSPLLRGELANRLAERLRLDERLLREELRRAAGEGRRQISSPSSSASKDKLASPAESQLLRAFLESPELRGEFLTALVEDGICEGLAVEGIFRRLLEAGQKGGVELNDLAHLLGPHEQRLLYSSHFSAAEPADRKQVLSCCLALRRRKAERQRDQLMAAIRAAERDPARRGELVELLQAKTKLEKDLAQSSGARGSHFTSGGLERG